MALLSPGFTWRLLGAAGPLRLTEARPSPARCRGPLRVLGGLAGRCQSIGKVWTSSGHRSVATGPPEQPCWGGRGRASDPGQPTPCRTARPVSPRAPTHCPQGPLREPPAEPERPVDSLGCDGNGVETPTPEWAFESVVISPSGAAGASGRGWWQRSSPRPHVSQRPGQARPRSPLPLALLRVQGLQVLASSAGTGPGGRRLTLQAVP